MEKKENQDFHFFLLKKGKNNFARESSLMAAIDLFCNPSSLCIDRPSLRVGSSCFSVEGKLRRSGIAYMASSVPIKEESRENLGCSVTGDSFIRPHLRKLSPYQPILPFEVKHLTLFSSLFEVFTAFESSYVLIWCLVFVFNSCVQLLLDFLCVVF